MVATVMGDSTLNFNVWKNSAGTVNGTVINYQAYEVNPGWDQYVTFSADTDTGTSITYTPLYSNSILYVRGTDHFRSYEGTGGGQGIAMGITRDGVGVSASSTFWPTAFYYKSDGINHHFTLECNVVVPANSTTATTFRNRTAVNWGGGEISFGFGTHRIEVWEIQQ